MTDRSPLGRYRPADVLVEREDFAAYVLLWQEAFGGERAPAFRAVDAWLDGWQRNPFADAETFRVWLLRSDRAVQVNDRKLAIELENRHSILMPSESRGEPSDDVRGEGGSLPIPSAADGLSIVKGRELRQLDVTERDAFLRSTIAALTAQCRRDPTYVDEIIRRYAEMLADA